MSEHYWSPEKVKDWVQGFVDAHGHMPNKRDMDYGGLKKHHRLAYGGVTGVLLAAGLTAASISIQRKTRDKERLAWLDAHNPNLDDDPVHEQPEPITTPLVNNLHTRNYSPSECVRYGRFALQKRNNSDFLAIIEKHSRQSTSPTISDYVGHFPIIDDLVRRRIRWESWHKMSLEDRQKLVLGYTCLTLARADGDIEYVQREMDFLHTQDMGPSYKKAMAYTQNRDSKEAPFTPVQAVILLQDYRKDPAIIYESDDIDPVFIPEILEALQPF